MKKLVLAVSLIGFSILLMTSSDLAAVETNNTQFAANEINSHADNLSKFIFGPVAKVAGVLGGGYGLISSVVSSSFRPLITFGGIGLAVALIPKFISSVFTLLLP